MKSYEVRLRVTVGSNITHPSTWNWDDKIRDHSSNMQIAVTDLDVINVPLDSIGAQLVNERTHEKQNRNKA